MKRILSLDCGGVRGFFSLEILHRIETLLREQTRNPDLVLADHFDFIGGTSTGAIVAAALAWGMPVERIREMYHHQCASVFGGKRGLLGRFYAKYSEAPLTAVLQQVFSEDGQGGQPALLGSAKVRTLLMVVMRNAATGAPWPITNNPRAMFNNPNSPECNLQIPLWQLVRASTAAPTYFFPEELTLARQRHVFVDGAVSPFGNPSFLMFLTATLPCYGLEWPSGEDQILMVSVGTGRTRVRLDCPPTRQRSLPKQVAHAVGGLLDSSGVYQDLLCRTMGRCLWGEPLDLEVGALLADEAGPPWRRQFTYVRYNHEFTRDELKPVGGTELFRRMDNLKLIPFLRDAGAAFAESCVRGDHLG